MLSTSGVTRRLAPRPFETHPVKKNMASLCLVVFRGGATPPPAQPSSPFRRNGERGGSGGGGPDAHWRAFNE